MRELQPHSGRHSETQNSGAHGIERARLVEIDIAVEVAFRGRALLGDDCVAWQEFVQGVEDESGASWDARPSARAASVREGALRSTGLTRLANVLRGGGNVADDAGAGERGGGILRGIGDLK